MAHFLKLTDEDGCVRYVNLDLITEVDVEEREITLANGAQYAFDDDLNDDREWNIIMGYVNTRKEL